MIPKTSEGKINNGYEKVFIQVFTKPQWASEDKLKVVCGKGPTPNNPRERLQDVKSNDEYIISITKPITNLKSAQMAVGANAVLSDMQN